MLNAIFTIFYREILLYVRNKGRVLASLGVPFFYLLVLGFGLSPILSVQGFDYFSFIVPGIIGMVLLFQSVFSGLSVVTERQFGFLKEILVAPIARSSIVLGKAAGNGLMTTLQGALVLVISLVLGFGLAVPWINVFWAIIAMFLIAVGFVALGLALAARIEDPQAFQFLLNFLIMPLFLLSGALYPLDTAPALLQAASYLDPLSYGVDLLRNILLGTSHFALWQSLGVVLFFDIVMVLVAAWLFRDAR